MSESRKIKRKLVFPNEENKKKKAPGTAVWSEEDEVSLLKGMIDYEVTQQSNPYAEMGKFLQFIRPSLHFNVERRQLTDKLWKLKNKFLCSKYDSTISHHAKLLDLSKSITSWGQHANMSLNAQNVVDQNVNVDNVVADVGDSDKLLSVVENDKKGKLVGGDGGTGQKENVAIEDEVCVDKGLEGVTKKRRLLSRDGENVKEVNVAKCSKKKGKLVISEDQINKEDDVVVDVGARKGELLVKEKSMGDVVTDDQTVEEDPIANTVVNDVQSPKKKGKKRVKVLGDEHVSREVNREDSKDFTSMFPELINMLELETLSMMPQKVKNKCVMDTINTMGWEKANELEEGWADVRLMEMELEAKKLDLTSKQMNLIVEATRRESRP